MNVPTPIAVEPKSLFSFNEIKVSYSCKQIGDQITNSLEAYDFLMKIWQNIDYEESFVIILLNRGKKVIGISRISVGSVSGTVADPKKVFQTALAANASSIILAHNHPSGSVRPSPNDELVTSKCKRAGHVLDLPITDHLIITRQGYFSFADQGML